jgi:hypothetical protein
VSASMAAGLAAAAAGRRGRERADQDRQSGPRSRRTKRAWRPEPMRRPGLALVVRAAGVTRRAREKAISDGGALVTTTVVN